MARILVVEDNALNIKLFCDLLAAHGHEPEAVTDSRTALERAQAFRPELIITDIQLPHISGIDIIARMRGDPGSSRKGRGSSKGRSGALSCVCDAQPATGSPLVSSSAVTSSTKRTTEMGFET